MTPILGLVNFRRAGTSAVLNIGPLQLVRQLRLGSAARIGDTLTCHQFIPHAPSPSLAYRSIHVLTHLRDTPIAAAI